MRMRFPSLTLRSGGNIVTSYVAIDSEQTIRLDQRRTGLVYTCTVQFKKML